MWALSHFGAWMSQKSSWLRHCGDCCGDYWFSCCQAFLWQSPQYHSPFCCVPPRAWSNRAFKPFKQLVAAALKRITQDKKLYEAHTQLGQEANDGLLTFWAFLGMSCQATYTHTHVVQQLRLGTAIQHTTVHTKVEGNSAYYCSQEGCG